VNTHEERAEKYAELFGVSGIEEGKYSDQIASCIEKSLLPKPEKYNLKKESKKRGFVSETYRNKASSFRGKDKI